MAATFTSPNQKRSEFANRCVIDAYGSSDKFSDYRNMAKSAPALIMQSGLIPTLTYIMSRKNNPDKVALGKDIFKWLRETNYVKSIEIPKAFGELFELSSDRYIDATQETFELLTWLRQLSDFYSTNSRGERR